MGCLEADAAGGISLSAGAWIWQFGRKEAGVSELFCTLIILTGLLCIGRQLSRIADALTNQDNEEGDVGE